MPTIQAICKLHVFLGQKPLRTLILYAELAHLNIGSLVEH
jgi:hypothetical protein